MKDRKNRIRITVDDLRYLTKTAELLTVAVSVASRGDDDATYSPMVLASKVMRGKGEYISASTLAAILASTVRRFRRCETEDAEMAKKEDTDAEL